MNEAVRSWSSLEPDAGLLSHVSPFVQEIHIRKINGTITDIVGRLHFNTILYIDVLEHIADDAAEISRATKLLDAHYEYFGRIIIVSPAHDQLFSEFNKKIGHVRRYDAASIIALAPDGFVIRRLLYLDSAGYFLSLANRFLLKQNRPTLGQIIFLDKIIIPLSRIFDRILFHKFGKTVVAIFESEC